MTGRQRFVVWVLVGVIMLGSAAGVWAEIRLAGLFSDHMVLQQGREAAVWGWANPGMQIMVEFRDQQFPAAIDAGGKWQAKVQTGAAGGPFELIISGDGEKRLQNVLVGEVWLCSGQSNMVWTVSNSLNPAEEIVAANYPHLRLLAVPRVTSEVPLDNLKASWQECTPQTVGNFSGVGYFFGRDLQKALDVPVGLINSSWGGTAAEAWASVPALEQDKEEYFALFERWAKMIADYPEAKVAWEAKVKEWEAECEKAKAENQPLPRKPAPPPGADNPNRPGNLYNAMIAPLVPYACRGALWYQGESNAWRAYQYRKLLPTMIANWRQDFGADLAFLIVQLANYMKPVEGPEESAWAELREAQALTARQPGNGLALAIDVGEANDIHPRDKQTVGARLALAARAEVYGQKIPYSGPQYLSHQVEGGAIRLSFTHTDGGLVARDGDLRCFALAGEDKKWVWGQARIEGQNVVVSSPEVPAPVAVRYNWANNPNGNLYNGAGLPAVPFRTDDWPGLTATAR
jgi:sialate O-acetylesterase